MSSMSSCDRDRGHRVSGPDAFSFLQSLVSQDVDGLDDGAVVASLLLTPKGKVDSWFRLVRVGDDAWLDCEAGFGDALASRARAVQAPGEGGDRGSRRTVGDGRDPRRRDRRRRRARGCRVLPVGWSTTSAST